MCCTGAEHTLAEHCHQPAPGRVQASELEVGERGPDDGMVTCLEARVQGDGLGQPGLGDSRNLGMTGRLDVGVGKVE